MAELTTDEFLVIIEPLMPWIMTCIFSALVFGFGILWICKSLVLTLFDMPRVISAYLRRRKKNGIRTAAFEYRIEHKDGRDLIYCNGKFMLACNMWDNAVAIVRILEEDDELFVSPGRQIDL